MRRIYVALVLFITVANLLPLSIHGQIVIANNETFPVFKDSIHLNLSYSKSPSIWIQWESSQDGESWVEIENKKKDSIKIGTQSTNYYRAKILSNHCEPYYSDTTLLKAGILTPVNSQALTHEFCFIESKFIEFNSAVYGGMIDGDSINLLVDDDNLVFIMPQLEEGTHSLNITVNEKDYIIDYEVSKTESIDNPESFVKDLIDRSIANLDLLKANIEDLINEAENSSFQSFDNYFGYIESNALDLNSLGDSLSEEEYLVLSYLLSGNPNYYSDNEIENKSANGIQTESTIPEIRLEKLPDRIYKYANKLSLYSDINDPLITLPNLNKELGKKVYSELLEDYIKHLKDVPTSLGKIFNVLNTLGEIHTSMIALQTIIIVKNLLHNKTYLLEGNLIPSQEQAIFFNNNTSIESAFKANYRSFLLQDGVNDKLLAVNNALHEFNIEFTKLLASFHFLVLESFNLIDFEKLFPVEYRSDEGKMETFQVPIEYIVSTPASISNSISNKNISLKSFNKKESTLEFAFSTNDSKEQEFTFELEYMHIPNVLKSNSSVQKTSGLNYNSVKTKLNAKISGLIPASLTIVSSDDPRVGYPSEPLDEQVKVIVKDADDNPVPGINISFYTECEDCGWVFNPIVPTNEKGIAQTTWALGSMEGFDYLKAKIVDKDEIPPVEFTATARILVPKRLKVVAATNNQCGEKEKELKRKIQLTVKDEWGEPVKNIDVEFYFESDGFGSFDPWVATTDKNGIAESSWTLGNFGVQQRAKAKIIGNDEIAPVQIFADTGEDCVDDQIIGKWKLNNSDFPPYNDDTVEWLDWGCNLKTIFECYEDGTIQGHFLYHENYCDNNETGLIKNGQWERNENGEYKISFTWFSETENRTRTTTYDFNSITFPDSNTMLIESVWTQLDGEGNSISRDHRHFYKRVE